MDSATPAPVLHLGDHVTLFSNVAKRSPILGYNHNIGHRGLVFHVQTEDSGVDNPHIFTHLFQGGVIFSSRKLEYDAAADEQVVKSLMQAQHKAVLKDLKRGSFDEKIDSYLGHHPDLKPGADDTDPERNALAAAPADEPASIPNAVDATADAEEISTDPAIEAYTPAPPTAAPPAQAAAMPVGRMTLPAQPPPLPPRRMPARHDTVEIHSPVPRGDTSDGTLTSVPRAPGVAGGARPRPSPLPPPVPPAAYERSAPPVPPGAATRTQSGKVLVSSPPIVVDPRKTTAPLPLPVPPAAAGHSRHPSPGHPSRPGRMTTPPRTAREEPQDNLFDQNMISERSLDEVILAYLSEDAGED